MAHIDREGTVIGFYRPEKIGTLFKGWFRLGDYSEVPWAEPKKDPVN